MQYTTLLSNIEFVVISNLQIFFMWTVEASVCFATPQWHSGFVQGFAVECQKKSGTATVGLGIPFQPVEIGLHH